jgi:hypothetical protein
MADLTTAIVEKRPLGVLQAGEKYLSLPVTLAPQTETIEVRLQRPTTKTPLNWDEKGKVRVSLVVTLDGQEHRCTGGTSGGIRVKADGTDHDVYIMQYTPSHGFFEAKSGLPMRLGEQAKSSYTGHVEIEVLEGSVETSIEVKSSTAPATGPAYHSSVAYQNATDGVEVVGDGTFGFNHTASGSDLAVFVGVMNRDATPAACTSATYAGAAMTEVFDNVGTFHAVAGYAKSNPTTGTQAVSATIAAASDYLFVGAISVTGAHQTTGSLTGTQQSSAGSGSSVSLDVSDTGADDLVIDVLGTQGVTCTIGANQTLRNTEAVDSNEFRMSTQLGADAGVMSWSFNTAGWYAYSAIALKPSAGGGATGNPQRKRFGGVPFASLGGDARVQIW